MTVLRGVAYALASAGISYTYNDQDDLKNVRRFLKRNLAPTSEEPYIYIEPLEAQFIRPAVTIRLLRTAPAGQSAQAARPTYDVEHALVVTAYGRDRAGTVSLAEAVSRLFHEGGADRAAYRIPMWDYASNGRLSRLMRVSRGSLSVGLEASDDSGLWSRPIELRVQAPRVRQQVTRRPRLNAVFISQDNTEGVSL